MNEYDLIERFNREIDNILDDVLSDHEQSFGDDYQQTVQLAQQLARADFSDESMVRQSLRHKLLTQARTPEEEWSANTLKENFRMLNTTRKLFIAMVTLLAVLVVGFFALPPVITYAQQILIQIGIITITDEPTDAEVLSEEWGQPEAEVDMGAMAAPTPNYAFSDYVMPLDEANQILGTSVLMPGFVPAGYELTLRFGGPNYPGGPAIHVTYNTAGNQQALIIDQMRLTSDAVQVYELGDAPITEVTVRGQTAIFAEQANVGWVNNALSYDEETGQVVVNPRAPGQEASTWALNVLLWEENGITFRLMADALPLEELLKVAESLTP